MHLHMYILCIHMYTHESAQVPQIYRNIIKGMSKVEFPRTSSCMFRLSWLNSCADPSPP